MRKLSKLKKLDLKDNPVLTRIPDFIWGMPALEEVLVDEKVLQSIQNGKRINKIIDLLSVWRNRKKWSDEQLRKFTMPHINGRFIFDIANRVRSQFELIPQNPKKSCKKTAGMFFVGFQKLNTQKKVNSALNTRAELLQ